MFCRRSLWHYSSVMTYFCNYWTASPATPLGTCSCLRDDKFCTNGRIGRTNSLPTIDTFHLLLDMTALWVGMLATWCVFFCVYGAICNAISFIVVEWFSLIERLERFQFFWRTESGSKWLNLLIAKNLIWIS